MHAQTGGGARRHVAVQERQDRCAHVRENVVQLRLLAKERARIRLTGGAHGRGRVQHWCNKIETKQI